MIKIVQGKKRSTIRELNRFTRNIKKGDKITFTDGKEIVDGKRHAPKVVVQVEDVKVCKLGELTDEDARA
jgi:hypothetical protein